MRTKLLLTVLGALAVAALGMGPAVASAEPVIFKNGKTGKTLSVGTKVFGLASNNGWVGTGGSESGLCNNSEFSGEVTKNKSDPATIKVINSIPLDCAYTWSGYRFKANIAATSINFFSDETADYVIGTTFVDVFFPPPGGLWGSYWYENPSAKDVKWPYGSDLTLETIFHLPQENGGPKFDIYAPFAVTLADKTPVKVEF